MTFFTPKKSAHEKAFAFPYAKQVKQQSTSWQEEWLFLNKEIWLGQQQPAFKETWPTTCQDLVHVCHLQRSYTLCSHKSKIMYILKKQTSKKTPKATYRSASISETHTPMNSSILEENCKEKLKGSHVLFSTSSACFLAFQISSFKNCRTLLGRRN